MRGRGGEMIVGGRFGKLGMDRNLVSKFRRALRIGAQNSTAA